MRWIESINHKQAKRITTVLSVVVFLAVVILNRRILPGPEVLPDWTYHLPILNAILNGSCFVLLLISLALIKKKEISMHKKVNLTAFVLSAIFLVSYVTFHYLAAETTYGGEGASKVIYYVILITHILTAAVVFPLVLLSFYYGLRDMRTEHRKLVKWAYPMWLYVTLTGVLVYLMISPYYPV
jgi:putative membrane protein